MPLVEYVNEEGYRLDGRKEDECRLIKINVGNENIFTDADGFAFYEIGNTKLLSYIQGPTELKKSEEKCSIKCERDGGVKHAAINTCILALIDAGIAIKYFISACSVLFLQNRILVDGNQLEINSGAPELTMVIELNTHKIVLLEFDAEVPIDIFEAMVRTCMDCCINLGNVMKLTVKENAIKLLCLNNMLNA
ncbi:exosome complex exonuclease rrp41 [Plasmodium vivax India VII]|uniref:Exosome complex exonuclease rrp41 n=1 Tax=Plasmodium vivax India VII TaxID=1077284 RepID=A0A0J9S9D1_PLAVI|nr:exosome complex exonuclease rrp41 [Plasmodium vivax India VII]